MANVPSTSVKRILSLSGNPNPETVIKILNTTGDDELLIKYMTDFHPEISSIMNQKFSHNKEYEFVDSKESSYYTNENYFLIMSLASTSNGTTKEEVSYNLGMVGLERLFELVEVGMVLEDKDGNYFGKNTNFKLSFSDIKKKMEFALKHYRLEEAGSVNNWLSFQTESVNKDGLSALKKLAQKHFNERKDQIYNNPLYSGDIKHFSASVASTFLPYRENGDIQ